MATSPTSVSRKRNRREPEKGHKLHFVKCRRCPNSTLDCKRFPFSGFRYSLTLFSKFFSSFPHGTCSLSVSRQYLALEGILPPALSCSPKQLDSLKACRAHANTQRRTGLSPSIAPFSKGLAPGPRAGNCFYRLQFGAHETRRFSV